MNTAKLQRLLEELEQGRSNVATVMEELRRAPVADLGFARIDTNRELRSGLPEVVYAEGKTAEQVAAAAIAIADSNEGAALVTRLDAEKAAAVEVLLCGVSYDPVGRVARLGSLPAASGSVSVAVLSAGTSDEPVVREAVATLEFFAVPVSCHRDVGVAGIHRLFAEADAVSQASVAIVVAGMDGALASVVGGLFAMPVIAVPTSVGYGASFEGLGALLAMLGSCAPGVTVVNIDNGFGAAAAAVKMLRAVGR